MFSLLLISSSFLLVKSIFLSLSLFFFFFNDTATTEIYTLSLHDALPISSSWIAGMITVLLRHGGLSFVLAGWAFFSLDRKSTRLNSSHVRISYAVFCLKKKKTPEAAFRFMVPDPRWQV